MEKSQKKFSPKNIVYGTRGSRAEYVTECTNYYCIASVLYETEYVFINIPENRITEQSQNKREENSLAYNQRVWERYLLRVCRSQVAEHYTRYAAEHHQS